MDAQPYAGPAYEYTAQTLASFNVLCSSIKNQCDKGLSGVACSNGQPSGQKDNCLEDEAAICNITAPDGLKADGDDCAVNNECISNTCSGTTCQGCQAYLECVYPSCSCSCDAGYYGEYCGQGKRLSACPCWLESGLVASSPLLWCAVHFPLPLICLCCSGAMPSRLDRQRCPQWLHCTTWISR